MSKRILFVDDEELVLSGLRRSLRRQVPKDWEMSFALGGQRGVEELSGSRYDVVVSDALMPDVNGAAVLDHARVHSPSTVRMVLSGQMDEAQAMSMLDLAHHLFQKPCPTETIVDGITEALRLHAEVVPPRLREFLAAIDGLPPAPKVYSRMSAVLAGGEASASDIGEIVQTDAALTARILRMVNSAFFALRREVTDANDAVAHLGFDLIRAVVLQQETNRFSTGLSREQLAEREERIDLMMGLCRQVAPPDIKAVAMSAVVLADIGEVVLALADADRWKQVVAERHLGRGGRLEVEARLFDVRHDEVGAALLAIWGLPSALVMAVRHHHEPAQLPEDRLVAFAHGLDAWTRWHLGGRQGAPEIDGDALTAAGLGDLPSRIQDAYDEEAS